MSDIALNRFRAAVVALAPLVLLIGFIWLPYVSDFTDEATVAEKVSAEPTRWAWAAIMLSTALGLSFASVVAIRMLLREAGERIWSPFAVLLVLVGGTVFLASGADLGYVYAVESGADVKAYTSAANDWMALRIVGTVVFGLGFLSLALAVYRSRVLAREWTWLVVAGYVVLTGSLFIPMGWAVYLTAGGAAAASWPLAYHMWGGELLRTRMGAARAARA